MEFHDWAALVCGLVILWFVLICAFIAGWSRFADRRRARAADSTTDARSAAMWAEFDEVTR